MRSILLLTNILFMITLLLSLFAPALLQRSFGSSTVDSIPVNGPTFEIAVNTETNMIYATSGSVFVIDGSINSQVTTISSIQSAKDVALNPNTNTIYVVTGSSRLLIIIDGFTNTITSTISLDYYTGYVAVNPETNMIYVSHGSGQAYSNLVSVIDGSTNAIITSIELEGNAYGDIGVNPDSNMLYVVSQHSDSLSVIDGRTNTLNATIPVGLHPFKVAVNPATNRIYVANYVEDTVSVVDGSTNSVIAAIPVGGYHPYTTLSNPYGIDVDVNTNLVYVVNQHADSVNVIDGDTNEVVSTEYIYGTQTVESQSPYGVSVNSETGKAYVTNMNAGFISVLDWDENSNNGAATANLTVLTADLYTGNEMGGYYTTLSKDGAVQNWLYTPASFIVGKNESYSVLIYDYGNYVFDHWEDTGLTAREREISISEDTTVRALFRNVNAVPPPKPTILSVDRIADVPWGSNVTVTGKLIDESTGLGIVDKEISFRGTGSSELPSFVMTLADGTFFASGMSPLLVNSWTVKAVFDGDEEYTESRSTTKWFDTQPHKTRLLLKVSPDDVTAGERFRVVATLEDTITDSPIGSKMISFTADSPLSLTDAMTAMDSGKAIKRGLVAPDSAGSYSIQAHFIGDELYRARDSTTRVLSVQ